MWCKSGQATPPKKAPRGTYQCDDRVLRKDRVRLLEAMHPIVLGAHPRGTPCAILARDPSRYRCRATFWRPCTQWIWTVDFGKTDPRNSILFISSESIYVKLCFQFPLPKSSFWATELETRLGFTNASGAFA